MIFDGVITALRSIESRLREKKKEKQRSPECRRVRDEHLEKFPMCEACGTTKELQVHHIKPFHLDPHLELDEDNLITLCMAKFNCHLNIGHGGSFNMYNPNVIQDSRDFKSSGSTSSKKAIIAEAKKNRLK
jgi:5-methylcytosine-specific restriction endonuclease McrA